MGNSPTSPCKINTQMFTLKDRKDSAFLLGPTHEEEITSLVAADIHHGSRATPLRLYQISRKFRDELHPRSGLLRCREFLMKDLYTFDESLEDALATYDAVRGAYIRIFDRIGVPYRVAEADSGDIGGDKSHEFHYVAGVGEDTLISCSKCCYTANVELAAGKPTNLYVDNSNKNRTDVDTHTDLPLIAAPCAQPQRLQSHTFGKHNIIRKLQHTLQVSPSAPASIHLLETEAERLDIAVFLIPSPPSSSPSAKNPTKIIPTTTRKITTSGKTTNKTTIVAYLFPRHRKPSSFKLAAKYPGAREVDFDQVDEQNLLHGQCKLETDPELLVAEEGDQCPECSSPLVSSRSIEVGHTFLLGTRYSEPLRCLSPSTHKPLQMGCYGIGVTRLLSAVIEAGGHDEKGIKWPVSIAPYTGCVIPLVETKAIADTIANDSIGSVSSSPDSCAELDQSPATHLARKLAEQLAKSPYAQGGWVVDDRAHSPGYKFADAELIGHPYIIVLGKKFLKEHLVEVWHRASGVRKLVPLHSLDERAHWIPS